MKKTKNLTRNKIVAAAWRLFNERGYEDTTIDEIVEESGTSKGSFYHYFEGKDALLGSLSIVFDEKYEELKEQLTPEMSAVDKLTFLNRELFRMIDNSVPLELLTRLLSSQLITRSEKHLLDRNRTYFRIISGIFSEGQESGEIRTDLTVNELVRAYAMMERGLMYDWCLTGGDYSLSRNAGEIMPLFLNGFRTEQK
ncbi:MAG: TetR/AcrR family transcriptional regulator [Lachnospiraceae bacterium]|nr:TetR/AcrR family transcriptional regulator [Lachnospiraceae bacterium]